MHTALRYVTSFGRKHPTDIPVAYVYPCRLSCLGQRSFVNNIMKSLRVFVSASRLNGLAPFGISRAFSLPQLTLSSKTHDGDLVYLVIRWFV